MMLRWLERPLVSHGELPAGITATVPVVKVLQYSVVEPWSFKDTDGKEYPGGQIVWYDVPTERQP